MFQRALEGYETSLGVELAASYIPALNTVYNRGMLFASQDATNRARAMFSRALASCQKVFGDDRQDCQDVREKLRSLLISAGERNTSADATSDCTPIASEGMTHDADQSPNDVDFFRGLVGDERNASKRNMQMSWCSFP